MASQQHFRNFMQSSRKPNPKQLQRVANPLTTKKTPTTRVVGSLEARGNMMTLLLQNMLDTGQSQHAG